MTGFLIATISHILFTTEIYLPPEWTIVKTNIAHCKSWPEYFDNFDLSTIVIFKNDKYSVRDAQGNKYFCQMNR